MTTEDKAPLSFEQLLGNFKDETYRHGRNMLVLQRQVEAAHRSAIQSAIEAERKAIHTEISEMYVPIKHLGDFNNGYNTALTDLNIKINARSTSQPNTKEEER